ncbi:VPLPA-CTERM sorting domain-containing protein [uncultured Roseobacter sp.]|uniref:VPLPA-CTERM sorting domain-containing protein n=1 Tax=uncultured Roseobacter sp. TaxID=114847 RepID=UPI0026238632|nr:VPLPA-CTERM sorting domain-containing protein [uncultured Roseobacter sp.]
MKAYVLSLSSIAVLSAGTAFAAPISADSDLRLYHSYVLNSGSVPQGIRLSVLPGSLEISGGAESSVDDPTATNSVTTDVVVGNPFSDPPLPYSASRSDQTTLPGGTEGAGSSFDVEVTAIDDPDADPFETSIIERTVRNSGSARAGITSEPVAAAAHSNYAITRGYLFENLSDDLISFNIVGDVRASFSAGYDGVDGFARTSGTIFNEFGNGVGAEIGYLPLAPYLRTVTEEGDSAAVAENLITGSDGFMFSAATGATGTGGENTAALDVTWRYLFSISLDPGGSLEMLTGFRQRNAVEYMPQPAQVPLPASLAFLLAGMAGLGVLRQRRAA